MLRKFTLFVVLSAFAFAQVSAQAPTVAAPTPTKAAVDVISVYSDAYTSIATNLDPDWGQATVATEVVIESNNTLEYAGLNYQGLEYPSTDVTAMEYVHLDYYTTDATSLEFFLIAGGENAYNIGTELGISTAQWVSVDIPMSYFADAGRDLTAAIQFKTVGNGTLYLDNLYFWKEPAASGTDVSLSDLTVDGVSIAGFVATNSSYTVDLIAGTTTVPTVDVTTTDPAATYVLTPASSIPGTTSILVTSADQSETANYTVVFLATIPPVAAPDPVADAANVISVYSDSYTSNSTNLFPWWGQATAASEIQIESNNTLKYSGLNYQGLEYSSSDVSSMEYLHLDYFTVDATELKLSVISPGAENAYDIGATDGITLDSWVSVDIPLTQYTVPDLTAVFQFKTEGNGTLYLDNLYFWKSVVGVEDLEKLDFSIYPNPATDFVQIKSTSVLESVEVFDLTGKSVLKVMPNEISNRINVSSLSVGVYVVRAGIDGGMKTAKFIKK